MKREWALPIVIALFYAASVFLNVSFRQHLSPPGARGDIIHRMFGSLRVFVGDWAFMKAEEYHHRGLPFEEALAYHHDESLFAEKEHHEELPESALALVQDTSIYKKIYSQVKVTRDSHLKPEEEKEVLPWFYIEVAFNPRDIRGYVLGGYWLQRMKKNDESLGFLKEGEKNNPNSAQIKTAIGELYFQEGNYAGAVVYLERACLLWRQAKGANVVATKYAESDRFFAFDLLADIYAKNGNNEKALQLYKELLKFGPNTVVEQKIIKLEGGS